MKNPKIVIIDYKIGNIQSVYNALKFLEYSNISISHERKIIENADILILPGVGAFDKCMDNLKKLDLDKILKNEVLIKNKKIVGICVGMQMLADCSYENGRHSGLGWIPGEVKKIISKKNYLVPHVGWNNIKIKKKSKIFNDKIDNCNFYFDHSYEFLCDKKYVVATTDYGDEINAIIKHKNIIGIQFHPERSQNNGLRIFRNILNSI